MTDKELANQIRDLLGTTPEFAMDPTYTKRCKEFQGEDPITFLRNLQDEMVYTGGCGDLIITLIDFMLRPFPEETAAEMKERRDKLPHVRKFEE